MEVLNNEKLASVKGGGHGFWICLGGFAALLAGLFAGFMQTVTPVCEK